MRVLLVEADPALVSRIEGWLVHDGFEVTTVAAPASVPVRPSEAADVVVVGLPDGDRLELCRAIRARDPAARLLMLTPAGSGDQAIEALEAGADDAIGRGGLSVRELSGRLRALGRRAGTRPLATPPPLVGPVRVDVRHQVAEVHGHAVRLSPVELRLLSALLARPGRVVDRRVLVQRVWGTEVDPRTVDTAVRRLRTRLGAAGELIETVRGVGYRYDP